MSVQRSAPGGPARADTPPGRQRYQAVEAQARIHGLDRDEDQHLVGDHEAPLLAQTPAVSSAGSKPSAHEQTTESCFALAEKLASVIQATVAALCG